MGGDTWEEAIKSGRRLKAHVLCFQEINLRRGDARLSALVAKADSLGYTAHISCIPRGCACGGTATLVAKSLACSKITFRTHSRGGTSTTTLIIPTLNTPSRKLEIANVYGSQTGSERVAQFATLRKHVNNKTCIVGDFNCVLDVALDTRRDATSPYPNAGADELASLVADLDLSDEIREQLGLGFEFTHQQTTSAGMCSSR